MTHIALIAALTAGLAAPAIAAESDRYKDVRFDTAQTFETTANSQAETTRIVAFSTNSGSSSSNNSGSSYHYANPLGVGPYNDSR